MPENRTFEVVKYMKRKKLSRAERDAMFWVLALYVEVYWDCEDVAVHTTEAMRDMHVGKDTWLDALESLVTRGVLDRTFKGCSGYSSRYRWNAMFLSDLSGGNAGLMNGHRKTRDMGNVRRCKNSN